MSLVFVEAKRSCKSAKDGEHQAKLYADALEKRYGQRLVISLTNGYDFFLWDDFFYPSRKVLGFYTKDDLVLCIQRRKNAKS